MIAAAMLLSVASAADFRIYPNFAEIRDRVTPQSGVVTVNLPQNATGFLVAGSFDLDGLELLSSTTRLVPSWLKTQEGQRVFVRVGSDGAYEPATLVRADDLLIRDAAGRFRNVGFEQLAFTSEPPRNPMQPSVQYTYRVTGTSGVLSYLTRGVTWSPRYTLRAEASNANLQVLADIRNNTDQDLTVNKGAELFAGQVQLTAGTESFEDGSAAFRVAPTAAPAPAPSVSALGELRGLQRYQLSEGFTLPGQSTLTVPFARPKISFDRFGVLNIPFTTRNADGTLSRGYRLRSDVFLPAGPVLVREEGRVVGQANISDSAANDPIELRLGVDPDLSYTRVVQNVRTVRDANNNVTLQQYRVTLTLENKKDRVVRAEVREFLGGNVTVEGQATRTNDGLEVRVDIPAKGKVMRTYTVTIRNS